MTSRSSPSLPKRTSVASSRPPRSTHTGRRPLTITSSTAGSSSSGCSGPRPSARSLTRRNSSSRVAGSSSAPSRSTSAAIRSDAEAAGACVGLGEQAVAQRVGQPVQRLAWHRSPSPTATAPTRRASPAARGSSRSSRANDCAAVRNTAWRSVTRSVAATRVPPSAPGASSASRAASTSTSCSATSVPPRSRVTRTSTRAPAAISSGEPAATISTARSPARTGAPAGPSAAPRSVSAT